MDAQLPRTLVLADDLTGALEMGVLARGGGHHVAVIPHQTAGFPATAADAVEWPDAATAVLDTESREGSALEAEQRLYAVLDGARWLAPVGLFKKTDSLLRGHIAAELAALAARFPRRTLVYVPAYPLLGRIVRGGRLLVREDHTPGNVTWRDGGSIVELLAPCFPAPGMALVENPQALQQALAGGEHRVLICQAETQADVDAYGAVLRGLVAQCIVAGPAGVFRALYGYAGTAALWPRLPAGVAFIGSRHAASIAQFEALRGAGRHRVAMSRERHFGVHAQAWREARDAGQWLVLRCPHEPGQIPGMRFEPLPEALYLSGGATAAACLRLLHCTHLEPMGELEPGVVYSEACLPDRRVPVFTKSGAFGDARTLVRVLAMLQGTPTPDQDS